MIAWLLLAHGSDPAPLTWDELAANLVKFLVTIAMVVAFSSQIMAPIFRNLEPRKRQEMFGWGALAGFLVLGMTWWVTRQTVSEVVAAPPAPEYHQHIGVNGGQVAMWGDYHIELARAVSGEFRVWLTDAYRRPIGNQHYKVKIAAYDQDGNLEEFRDMDASLGGDYRFSLMDQADTKVKLRVAVPGWEVALKFDFDESRGKKSLQQWCGTSK